ncbi:hypothetical protein NDU88_010293 [Pleurodeles waltl]|uniref:Uncharacterized protein n=1 Tax=Pleurodeles waltl TaxID=8319 RepID=A0AAV7S2W6_PLEWA|nr:hypothetical protein NDU88_010293 [Pleurodeles waltl]KAJ1157588.1 hypothetical protein NDU88_010293 [Pleurodeles waltl]
MPSGTATENGTMAAGLVLEDWRRLKRYVYRARRQRLHVEDDKAGVLLTHLLKQNADHAPVTALVDVAGRRKLLAVYQEASVRSSPLGSMREAWVAFIPKLDRDLMYPAAYRPLSLLNVDIKILSGIVVARLLPHLTFLIHEDQCDFTTIFNIRRLTHIYHTYLQ